MKIIIKILFIFTSLISFSQNEKSQLFKGNINENLPITLYLKIEQNDCTGKDYIYGMYKYKNSSNWLLLSVEYNEKGQYILVEENFTGALILNKKEDNLEGLWISPDYKKQLKVQLTQNKLSKKESELYLEILDKLNYEMNDC